MKRTQKRHEDYRDCTTGEQLISIISIAQSSGRGNIKRLMRARRKAHLIDSKALDADDMINEAHNAELVSLRVNETHEMYLHPTKGYRKHSKQRSIFAGATQAHMWELIKHNVKMHARGKKKEILRSEEWVAVRNTQGLPV